MSTTAAQPVCQPTAAAAQPVCALKCEAELTAYASAAEASVLAVASLQAPPAPVDAARAPLELVAVLDRSGSMSGQKMMLMKQTLNLLVTRSGLQAQDKLGIVVFDHDVQTVLPLTSMDQAGRLKAKAAIDAVCVGGRTNLSGGLIQGLQMLCQSDEKAREQADDAAADGEATVVVGDDEQVQTIPNAKFISNKISNRSRRTHRCMKQSIYLTYGALPKARDIIETLQERLRERPTVDSGRNFRVYIKAYTQTAIQIEVEIRWARTIAPTLGVHARCTCPPLLVRFIDCACVCVHPYVRACVCALVCACMRASMRPCDRLRSTFVAMMAPSFAPSDRMRSSSSPTSSQSTSASSPCSAPCSPSGRQRRRFLEYHPCR